MPPYTVQQGDTLDSIALEKKLKDWRSIYEHGDNAWFKEGCESSPALRSPDILYPGECLEVPSRRLAEALRSIDDSHQFVVQSQPKTGLRLRLMLGRGPLKDAEWELTVTVGGKLETRKGKTGKDGLVEADIDVGAREATLKVADRTFDLQVGHLNPLDSAVGDKGISGLQGRLRNLGYDPGPIDGIVGPLTRAATRAFQRDNPPLAVDGIFGPKTRAVLLERYGC